MGDFASAIGQGIAGLVGGSIDALSSAFNGVLGVFQSALPGPLFPIAIVVGIVVLAVLFKRLF